jgi:hypothetical protein
MAMSKKEKDAFLAEVKKRGNIKKGEIISPGSVVRGVAKVAAKVAGKTAKDQVGVSVRSKSVDSSTKRMVTKQNKAAESYKIKDLDKLEKGRVQRAEKKIRDAAARKAELKKAEKKGLVKGATATAGLGVAGLSAKLAVASKDKKESKKKGKK